MCHCRILFSTGSWTVPPASLKRCAKVKVFNFTIILKLKSSSVGVFNPFISRESLTSKYAPVTTTLHSYSYFMAQLGASHSYLNSGLSLSERGLNTLSV